MSRITMTSLIFSLLMLSLLTDAGAELVPVRVMLGSREAALASTPVFDGSRMFAPLAILDSLGATCTVSSHGDKATVTTANGESGEIEINGSRMIPLDKLMTLVGGKSVWDAEKHTLTLLARLESVEFVDSVLRVNCSFPVACKVSVWAGKIIVDIPDSVFGSAAKEVYIGTPVVSRARLSQYTPTSTRVVLDLDKPAESKLESDPIASQIRLHVAESIPLQPQKPKSDKKPPFEVSEIRIDKIDDNQFNLVIATSGKATVTSACEVKPPRIVLDLIGGTLGAAVKVPETTHPLLKDVKFVQESLDPARVRVELNLTRVAIFDVRADENAITVNVRLPDKSGGEFSSKFVVIDAGHGGRERGAVCVGVNEKDLNFKIARELAAALQAEGVRTMLTRDGDQALSLASRSEAAINNSADFFISIHCNSNTSPGSASGIETYYHMQEPSPKALACAVHAGVCIHTGMCDRKPRSDRSLYGSGLGVLRRLESSGIPGILLECGYLNHAGDRAKLQDDSYRKKLARGIVAGLKAYVEGK